MNLQDASGRAFPYLRLSVTDACNFRCVYCLPNGYQKPANQPEPLRLDEINRLLWAFSDLGMWKLRLTGGEPTLRRDLCEIVKTAARIPTIRKIALSTNGYRLKFLARELKDAGVSALNISIDTLDRARFAQLTGVDQLQDVLDGVETALETGFEAIKINSVLVKGLDDGEVENFLSWIESRAVTVRFIELMPTGQTKKFFDENFVPSSVLSTKLLSLGWQPKARGEADGPAQEFTRAGSLGGVGIIAPYSKNFCQTCNRLRVTSQGALQLCLFADGNHSLRPLLQNDDRREELKNLIRTLIGRKDISHYLPEGRFGNNQTFSATGG